MTLIRGDLQVRRSLLDQLQHAAQHTDDGPERPVLVLEDRQLNRCGGFVGLLAGEGDLNLRASIFCNWKRSGRRSMAAHRPGGWAGICSAAPLPSGWRNPCGAVLVSSCDGRVVVNVCGGSGSAAIGVVVCASTIDTSVGSSL
jgi:hypothetical protein